MNFDIETMQRFFVQPGNQPKRELDLRVQGLVGIEGTDTPLILLIEVKKWKYPVDLKILENFWQTVAFYQEVNPKEKSVLPQNRMVCLNDGFLSYKTCAKQGTSGSEERGTVHDKPPPLMTDALI